MIKDIIIHILKGRTRRKEPFGHTSPLEPQPRGAVTHRAVAQRRSRASGLTRPLTEAIRSGPLRWACLGGCEKMGRL